MNKLFNFDKDSITRHIEHKLETFSKMKEPFKFVVKKLIEKGHNIIVDDLEDYDLNKIVEDEGKNYNWSVVQYENVTLLMRRYGTHITIFTQITTDRKDPFSEGRNVNYGAFTLNVDTEKFDDDKQDEMMEMYYDSPFTDLNVIFKNFIECIDRKRGDIHWVWNPSSMARPDHVKVKYVFSGKSISSVDTFIFCMEELTNAFQSLFAETTIVERLKDLKGKEGKKLDSRYILKEVREDVSDCFHNAGMTVIDTFGGKKESKWNDVYLIGMHYLEHIFPEGFYMFDGDIYVDAPNGKLIVGNVCIAKDDNDEFISIYQEKFPANTWTALRKL